MKEQMCLTDKMLGVLVSLKGKTLKSYEAHLVGYNGAEAWQVVVLHTGSLHVPVVRQEDPERELFGEPAEYAPFECYVLDPSAPYRLMSQVQSRYYLIGERITAIEIVRDTATWRGGSGREDEVLEEDAAIVIRTSGHVLGLSAYSSESILVQLADSPDAEPPVLPVEEYWELPLKKSKALTVGRRIISL